MSKLRKSKGLKLSKPLGATTNFFILEGSVVNSQPRGSALRWSSMSYPSKFV
jgi:hypothetical protein